MSLLIKNGLVVTSTGSYTADVYVEAGKIKTIGIDLDNAAQTIIDARGKYVLPGAIDPHTHLAMPFMGTFAQ
ncbi:MAG: dihydropyrimidinase, partial [Desulfobacula sp.]|nr:dihydropyrimidinase [Desulfobacula sp.]